MRRADRARSLLSCGMIHRDSTPTRYASRVLSVLLRRMNKVFNPFSFVIELYSFLKLLKKFFYELAMLSVLSRI